MVQSESEYVTIKMNYEPTTSNSYKVSGTIPADFIDEPGIKYWIRVVNSDVKVQESSKFVISLEPDYPINAKVNVAAKQNVAEGKTINISAEILNESIGPIIGYNTSLF